MKVILNIRVEESIKEEIERLSQEEGISSSEFGRNILNDYLDFEDGEKIPERTPTSTLVIDCTPPFHKDKRFISLTSWLFSKALFPWSADSNAFITSVKSMIESALQDQVFHNDLRFEFLKVLNDINRYLIEPDSETKRFNFCIQNNLYSFNYNLLMKEVWRISQDD